MKNHPITLSCVAVGALAAVQFFDGWLPTVIGAAIGLVVGLYIERTRAGHNLEG